MIEFPHLMQALMVVVALASMAVTIILNRGKAAADRVTDLEKALSVKAGADAVRGLTQRVDHIEVRTTTIEADMRHLPNREQTHAMELTLKEVQGQLALLNERMIPVANTNARLQDYLLSLGERS